MSNLAVQKRQPITRKQAENRLHKSVLVGAASVLVFAVTVFLMVIGILGVALPALSAFAAGGSYFTYKRTIDQFGNRYKQLKR